MGYEGGKEGQKERRGKKGGREAEITSEEGLEESKHKERRQGIHLPWWKGREVENGRFVS